MELEEIKSKNLPVVETYEEFGEKLNEIDFSQEDFAALVTDLTSVLYADSLETVWGFIGFQWDEYNNYGHFNTRSFEVGYIPQIPDPERILKLPRNFISLMNDKEIIIGYNKFTNLTEIDYIAQDNGKNLTIYTDGITCPLNLYDINTFGDSEKMDFRSIQFIGTKLPTLIICRGRIGRTQQINEKPIYINVDERLEFKLPYQSSKNYWLNNNVRWIGSGDFIISDYMEKGSGISQYINFQSLNNTFIINPSTLYFNCYYNYSTTTDFKNLKLENIDLKESINITIDFENKFNLSDAELEIRLYTSPIKSYNLINLDKILNQIKINNTFARYICYLDYLDNAEEVNKFPFQKIIDACAENKLTYTDFLYINIYCEFEKFNKLQLNLNRVNINLNSTRLLTNETVEDLTFPITFLQSQNSNIWFPYVKEKKQNMNYTFSDISSLNNAGIITFDSISARYVNLPYQYTIYIDSDCIILCHALYFSLNIVYLSETYQNRYIIYITLDYFDLSISTRFQFRLKNAKDNSKIATKLLQYHQNEIIWLLVKIYNTNIEIPLDVKISIGVIFHNGTGGNVTFFKNVLLLNSDGLYLLNNNENNYVIVDITLWNMFYNASIIIVAIQSNIHSFVDSIIDVECTNDNCEISIVHENYVQLTAEERNKIINLGYTLIDYVI